MIRSGTSAARRGEAGEVDRKPVITPCPGLHLALKAQDTVGRTLVHTARRTNKLRQGVAVPSAGAPATRRDDEMVDRKPTVIKPGAHVRLKVQDTEGRTVKCTVRRAEKLQCLMDLYYARTPDVPRGTGRFLYDGGRLAGWQMPAVLERKDGDVIDFFTELMGGGRAVAGPVHA